MDIGRNLKSVSKVLVTVVTTMFWQQVYRGDRHNRAPSNHPIFLKIQ